MRKLLLPLFTILFVAGLYKNSSASSYLKFWIDGSEGNTLVQGQMLAWETNVTVPGSTLQFELYLDKDGSHTLNAGDMLFERFQMRDGDAGGNDGPSDSSATPDGIIYVNFGPFGFAPENYLLKVIDTDNSSVTNWFSTTAMPNPPATISGQVDIEDLPKPNALYKNIMIGAQGQGMFTGLTDDNGNYTINLPETGSEWYVEIFFRNTVQGYIANEKSYDIQANAGNTGSINFTYSKPRAWVYGDLRNEVGTLINNPVYVGLQNETIQSESSAMTENGHFNIPAVIEVTGGDSTNDFRFYLDSQSLIPTYMVPSGNELFELSWGDSLQKNLVAYTTNAVISGYVTENGNVPSKAYRFHTSSQTYGYTETMSDPESGYFELHVRDGETYYVGLQDDPDWGTPPPPGYIVSDGNWKNVNPGETVYFNLVPAGNILKGSISFDEGDPVDFNFERNRINASTTEGSANYGTRINENLQYELAVSDGIYNISFSSDDNKYLAKPWQYNSVEVSQDTVEQLDFELNYAHAEIVVKLVNAPIPGWFTNLSIDTNNDEDFYQTWADMRSDSTFHLKVCEGNWHIGMPFFDSNYEVLPGQDTTLVVTESDSSFYIVFVYKMLTDIGQENILPQKFALGQNYPNPFNPATTIEYQLAKQSQVSLSIFNLLGQKVTTLVSGKQAAGAYKVEWDAGQFSSGVYLYRLETDKGYSETKKLILLK